MPRTSRCLLLAALAFAAASPSASAEGLGDWYFPQPYTMEGPLYPARGGGMEFDFTLNDMGWWGFGFPMQGALTTERMNFVATVTWPLVAGEAEQNLNEPGVTTKGFYWGNIKIGVQGAWKFLMPFAEGFRLPAAWGVGADVGLPWGAMWVMLGSGAEAAAKIAKLMYQHDPVAIWPKYMGIAPKALFAIGRPLFYVETEIKLPMMFNFGDSHQFLFQYGVALGTQPLKWLAFTAEFGGYYEMRYGNNQMWWAAGLRFYVGKMVLGAMFRMPLTYVIGTKNEPAFSMGIYLGAEKRQPEIF
jgi:hypothetical protein